MGKRISYSQLSMFSECPLRWKLNYVDGLRILKDLKKQKKKMVKNLVQKKSYKSFLKMV